MFTFLRNDQDLSLALQGQYDIGLVLLSYLIACVAAYVAWEMADRLRESEPGSRWRWLGGGAAAMGVGVWAMHFVGMLAFKLPIPVTLGKLDPALAIMADTTSSATPVGESKHVLNRQNEQLGESPKIELANESIPQPKIGLN